jgi:hypothetical protein
MRTSEFTPNSIRTSKFTPFSGPSIYFSFSSGQFSPKLLAGVYIFWSKNDMVFPALPPFQKLYFSTFGDILFFDHHLLPPPFCLYSSLLFPFLLFSFTFSPLFLHPVHIFPQMKSRPTKGERAYSSILKTGFSFKICCFILLSGPTFELIFQGLPHYC